MKKLITTCATCMLAVSLCACSTIGGTPTASPNVSTTPEPVQEITALGSSAQQPDVRDYTYSWWPDAPATSDDNNFCVQTGYYGMSFSSVTGLPLRMGVITEEYSQTAALTQNEGVIKALPAVEVAARVTTDNTYYFTGDINKAQYSKSVLRIIESGQYMQSFEIGAMVFADGSGNVNDTLIGRTEIKATPRYFALNYQLFYSLPQSQSVGLEYRISFDNVTAEILNDGSAAILKFSDGTGFAVVMPEGSVSFEQNTLILKEDGIMFEKKNTTDGLSAIFIPSASPSQADIDYYYAITNLEISGTTIAPKADKDVDVSFDTLRGIWSLNTNSMVTATGTQFKDEDKQDLADRLSFTVTNPSNVAVKIPLEFIKDRSVAVEGFGPMIRDVNTGEPMGIQIQISKNWHPYTSEHRNQWYYGLDGRWFHGYTYIEIPANSSVTYEYMNAFNNYGNVSVASHGQLCLIGWPSYSTHQIWHTSTIGSAGEAFCYDPDFTCGYGFINDVRGVGFDPYDKGQEYVWGCNNGGGNFLWYGDNGTNNFGDIKTVEYKNMKVFYKTYAPNMAEVIFSGVTQDDAVEFTFTTYIARTNDVSRATHTFEYKFVKDVTFERMAFYQIGGDRHNSGRWHGLTIGNDDGPIEYEIAGVTYGAEADIPVSDTADYVGGNGMQRIEVPGDGLWVAFTDSYKKVNSDYFDAENANRTLSLLEFKAVLNGVTYNKPAFNIRSTEMFCGNSTIVELCPSAEVGNTIKAGSTVKGAVEYINLPFSLSSLYCESAVLRSIPADEFDTWKLAYRYALGDKTAVTAQTGEVVRNYPIAIKCVSEGDVIAQLTVKGGISYLPITFKNVPSYSGYRLEKQNGNTWETVDQSFFGNDYWQTYYDPETDSYELTFNVEHSGDPDEQYVYRLVKTN